ncbi:MAG: FISUMP domain-containing protein [Chitinophagales bacterium]
MKVLLQFIFLVFGSILYAQNDTTFIDSRDDETYKIKKINGVLWMIDNLRYETPASSYYKNDKENYWEFGRYYSKEEAKIACPEGWRLPNLDDFDSLKTVLLENAEIREEYLEGAKDYVYLTAADFSFFNPQYAGWIQGKRYKRKGTQLNIWFELERDTYIPYHLHLTETLFTFHFHDHHIHFVRKFKKRKFSVRCVCEK